MNKNRHVSFYRFLAKSYPKSFRNVYASELVHVFERQIRDVGASRVWRRTARDLIVSVPRQHLEANVSGRSNRTLTIVALSIAAGFAVLATLSDAGAYGWLWLLVTAVGLLVAALARRAPIAVEGPGKFGGFAHQKRLFGTGAVVLVGVVMVVRVWPRSGDIGLWWLAIPLALVGGISLLALGLTIGIAQWKDLRVMGRAPTSVPP
jgi:hypothetical protein